MKHRLLALAGAFVLAAWLALPALAAAPPGTVTIEATGCSFLVHINLDQAYDVVGWKVKEYNAANWNDGLTLFKGSGPSDPNGDLTVGPFTAPEGHYNVAVDNEYPPDGSSIVVDFFLSCPAGSQSPTGSEAPAASEQPTGSEVPAASEQPASSEAPAASEQPSGGELSDQGSPPPTGEELGISGTGPTITPPPTDTGASMGGKGGGVLPILVVVMVVSMTAFALMPRRILSAARATVRRRR